MKTITKTTRKKVLFTVLSLLFISFQVSALTYNVTVPTGTETCYIAGGFNGWSVSANPMTKVDDTHFTIEIAGALATDGYEYLSGPAWAYEQTDATGTVTSQASWSENDVVIGWKNYYTTTPLIKVHVPSNITECYIVTSLDDWTFLPEEQSKMSLLSTDETGKIFSITLTGISDPTALRYRFSASLGWTNEQTNPSTEFAWSYGVINNVYTFAGIITNAINNSTIDSNIKIIDKSIVIENANSDVEIFNITGNCIVKEKNIDFISKHLKSGVYIVKINDFVKKVIIE